MKTMDEMWADYQSNVVPELASDGQIAATRHSFYAGAYLSMMQLVENVSSDDSEEVHEDRASDLFAEIEVYLASSAGMIQ